jgi:hypothetical protein
MQTIYYVDLHVACFPATKENKGMRHDDQKIYRTFEEFEREELRRADGFSTYMDDMLGEMFAEELDLELRSSHRNMHDDEDE